MDVHLLRTFLAVAEAGSLTRAAEQVHLSQPAVSAQVKALEGQLGLALFRRSGRGMELTAEGERLVREAREIVVRVEGMSRLADRLRGDVTGVLRLGAIHCGYDLLVPRMVALMTQRFSEIEIRLEAATSGENLRAVLEDRLDVAVMEAADLDGDRVEAWRLGTSHLVVIAPMAWRPELEGAGWGALAARPWVFQGDACSHHWLLQEIAREHSVTFTPRFQSEAYGEVKDLVAEGVALSLCDEDEASALIESGRLYVWPGFRYSMPVWLVCRRGRSQDPGVSAFVEVAMEVHGRKGLRVPASA